MTRRSVDEMPADSGARETGAARGGFPVPWPKGKQTAWQRALAIVVTGIALAWTSATVQAEIPEPDVVLYGSIALDGGPVGADRTDVTVEVRAEPGGPVLTGYRMGSDPAAGNFYLLRIRVEAFTPVRDAGAAALGSTVRLTVRDASGPRDEAAYTLAGRGQIARLDFGDVDTDGDGMSDAWELAHFGSITGANPDDDPDGDGRSNLTEFLQGTDPLTPDGWHPADRSPTDWAIDIREVTEYALAWKLGEAWSTEPHVIPVDYVTRASALWVGGEHYAFENDPPTTAPLWWVNVPPPALPATHGPAGSGTSEEGTDPAEDEDREAVRVRARLLADARAVVAERADGAGSAAGIRRAVPHGRVGVPEAVRAWSEEPALYRTVQVTLLVRPSSGTRAFAVEETPPPGWRIRYINSEGRLDTRQGRIRWGPFYGGEPRTLGYELTALNEAAPEFAGTASFDGASVTVGGVGSNGGGPAGGAPDLSAHATTEGLTLTARGAAELTYRVEFSADLTHWIDAGQVTTDASGEARVLVPRDGNGAAFFRLRAD